MIFILLTFLDITGCREVIQSQTSHDTVIRSGVLSEFGYAARGNRMPIVVLGNPYPEMSQRAFERSVIDAMQGNLFLYEVNLVPAADNISRSGYRIVAFLADSPVPPEHACSLGPDVDVAAGSTETMNLWLLTAFCGGETEPLSWALASSTRPSSPEDPLFRALVTQATFDLLPPRDESFENRLDR